MPYEEYMGWMEYFSERPYGWQDDYRTYMLMKVSGDMKASPAQIFPSLAKIYKQNSRDQFSTLKSSNVMTLLLSAKGGDKVNFGGNSEDKCT